MMTEEQWKAACYEAILWIDEGAADEIGGRLLSETKRLGKRRVSRWIEAADFNDREACLMVAEVAGMA